MRLVDGTLHLSSLTGSLTGPLMGSLMGSQRDHLWAQERLTCG